MLLGGDPWRQASELHHRIAYVPGDVSLWPNLTGGEVSTCSAGCVANEISQVARVGIRITVMFLVVRHTRAELVRAAALLLLGLWGYRRRDVAG